MTAHKQRFKSAEERFWATVDKRGDDECWNWKASLATGGYGSIVDNGINVRAHRFSYELHKGKIPPGLFVCHSCDNRACVNPKHLWIGTNAENIKDRDGKGRHANSKKTHCLRGHILSGENLLIDRNGYRVCRKCGQIRQSVFRLSSHQSTDKGTK